MVVLVHLPVLAWWSGSPPCLQAHMALSWGDSFSSWSRSQGPQRAEKNTHALCITFHRLCQSFTNWCFSNPLRDHISILDQSTWYVLQGKVPLLQKYMLSFTAQSSPKLLTGLYKINSTQNVYLCQHKRHQDLATNPMLLLLLHSHKDSIIQILTLNRFSIKINLFWREFRSSKNSHLGIILSSLWNKICIFAK